MLRIRVKGRRKSEIFFILVTKICWQFPAGYQICTSQSSSSGTVAIAIHFPSNYSIACIWWTLALLSRRCELNQRILYGRRLFACQFFIAVPTSAAAACVVTVRSAGGVVRALTTPAVVRWCFLDYVTNHQPPAWWRLMTACNEKPKATAHLLELFGQATVKACSCTIRW